MLEINGVKYFEGSDNFGEVKARSDHYCALCGVQISRGNIYCRYVEQATGWERKACCRHLNGQRIHQFEASRRKYMKKREAGEVIRLETDASGPEGERWAFVGYLHGQEIFRKRGYTPAGVKWITPAEGYAILMAVEWLSEAENEAVVEAGLAVVVGSDNDAVASKLDTQSQRGGYEWLWRRLNQVLLPYRREGRLFVEGWDCSAAHSYAQKWE